MIPWGMTNWAVEDSKNQVREGNAWQQFQRVHQSHSKSMRGRCHYEPRKCRYLRESCWRRTHRKKISFTGSFCNEQPYTYMGVRIRKCVRRHILGVSCKNIIYLHGWKGLRILMFLYYWVLPIAVMWRGGLNQEGGHRRRRVWIHEGALYTSVARGCCVNASNGISTVLLVQHVFKWLHNSLLCVTSCSDKQWEGDKWPMTIQWLRY